MSPSTRRRRASVSADIPIGADRAAALDEFMFGLPAQTARQPRKALPAPLSTTVRRDPQASAFPVSDRKHQFGADVPANIASRMRRLGSPAFRTRAQRDATQGVMSPSGPRSGFRGLFFRKHDLFRASLKSRCPVPYPTMQYPREHTGLHSVVNYAG